MEASDSRQILLYQLAGSISPNSTYNPKQMKVLRQVSSECHNQNKVKVLYQVSSGRHNQNQVKVLRRKVFLGFQNPTLKTHRNPKQCLGCQNPKLVKVLRQQVFLGCHNLLRKMDRNPQQVFLASNHQKVSLVTPLSPTTRRIKNQYSLLQVSRQEVLTQSRQMLQARPRVF